MFQFVLLYKCECVCVCVHAMSSSSYLRDDIMSFITRKAEKASKFSYAVFIMQPNNAKAVLQFYKLI